MPSLEGGKKGGRESLAAGSVGGAFNSSLTSQLPEQQRLMLTCRMSMVKGGQPKS